MHSPPTLEASSSYGNSPVSSPAPATPSDARAPAAPWGNKRKRAPADDSSGLDHDESDDDEVSALLSMSARRPPRAGADSSSAAPSSLSPPKKPLHAAAEAARLRSHQNTTAPDSRVASVPVSSSPRRTGSFAAFALSPSASSSSQASPTASSPTSASTAPRSSSPIPRRPPVPSASGYRKKRSAPEPRERAVRTSKVKAQASWSWLLSKPRKSALAMQQAPSGDVAGSATASTFR
ncbi:hypothetical protein AURDEDRAFT_116367 [Auricularia subglabra TFB-10046 SS5]|nr:hypothetical protein AURDEDRAFT_116367 [Auricularia subglabra TFB-10046 SS5]